MTKNPTPEFDVFIAEYKTNDKSPISFVFSILESYDGALRWYKNDDVLKSLSAHKDGLYKRDL